MQPCAAEIHEQAVLAGVVCKMAAFALQAQIRRSAAVAHDARMDAVAARHHRRARGQARRVGTIILVKAHALPRKGVDHGRGIAAVAVAPEVIGAQRIDIKK